MEYFHYDKAAMEETNASFALRINNDRWKGPWSSAWILRRFVIWRARG